MLTTLAPMESLTGIVFRRRHREFFGGADLYYTPFVTPTEDEGFTERQMRELSPEGNEGIPLVPQLLTKSPRAFAWAARELARLGYGEVNLNVGCPMGTVTAKGKGSGLLRHPLELRSLLDQVFSCDLPIGVSIKTRLGWACEEEFGDLVKIYSDYPLRELVVHARVRADFYRGPPRVGVFEKYLPNLPMPVGYNGDLRLVSQIRGFGEAHPGLRSLMVGRAAVANPAVFRMAKGGAAATTPELLEFHNALFSDYCRAFGSVGNTVGHMKQYMFYMKNLFDGGEKLFKALLKSRRPPEYEALVREIFTTVPLLGEASYGWFRPASRD